MFDLETKRLNGARIWLSGAIPTSASPEQKAEIEAFVRQFASAVFREGGSIIHGSHPTLRAILLECARVYQAEERGSRDCLTLVLSQWFSEDPVKHQVNIADWQSTALVHLSAISFKTGIQDSLTEMRGWMADRCDAMVAIGGNWWEKNPGVAGVPDEIEMARERGLPCFLLGGLGGAAKGYIEAKPELLKNLRNGLSESRNRSLALNDQPGSLAYEVLDQLGRLCLVRGQALGGSSFRILALDGGGIKGAFTASVLAEWEKSTGLNVAEHFDIIAGTSTGGILACGLAAGLSAATIRDFYKIRGATIFGNAGGKWQQFRRLFRGPIFDAVVLRKQIAEAFSSKGALTRAENAKCRLVLPTVLVANGEPRILRTPHHPTLIQNRTSSLVDLALATAAAPVFFRAAKIGSVGYLDGGLWANNPVLAAVTEAVSYLRVPLDRIDVLSISTTSAPFDGCHLEEASLLKWLLPNAPILEAIMGSTAKGHEMLANALVGQARHLRIDAMLPPGAVSLANYAKAEVLIQHGAVQASNPDSFRQVQSRFLNGVRAAPWQKF
jgi:uncharacterized protein